MPEGQTSELNEQAIRRAITLLNNNRLDDALAILEAMPQTARVRYLLAFISARQGQRQNALEQLYLLLQQHPGYGFAIALLDELQGHFSEQASLAQQDLEFDIAEDLKLQEEQGPALDYHSLAQLSQSELVDQALRLFQISKIEQAKQILEHAVSRNEPAQDLYYTKAILHFHREEFQEGLECLKLELKHYPENEAAIELHEELRDKIK